METVFKEEFFIPFVVRRVFGLDELVISIGNFLGLILGASLLSIIEFVYFLVVPSCSLNEFVDNRNRKNVFIEFAEGSTIHGLNHVANRGRPYLER
jgi:hypothetical protein